MPSHSDKKCRRCSCRRQSCQRRRAGQRRQGKSLLPHAQFLLLPSAGALFQHRRRHNPVAPKEPPFTVDRDDELDSDEIEVDSEDLKVMRDSVNAMQQQLRRGLRDIQEIRALVKQAAAQRELERHEMNRSNAEANNNSRH